MRLETYVISNNCYEIRGATLVHTENLSGFQSNLRSSNLAGHCAGFDCYRVAAAWQPYLELRRAILVIRDEFLGFPLDSGCSKRAGYVDRLDRHRGDGLQQLREVTEVLMPIRKSLHPSCCWFNGPGRNRRKNGAIGVKVSGDVENASPTGHPQRH